MHSLLAMMLWIAVLHIWSEACQIWTWQEKTPKYLILALPQKLDESLSHLCSGYTSILRIQIWFSFNITIFFLDCAHSVLHVTHIRFAHSHWRTVASEVAHGCNANFLSLLGCLSWLRQVMCNKKYPLQSWNNLIRASRQRSHMEDGVCIRIGAINSEVKRSDSMCFCCCCCLHIREKFK